MKTSEQLTGTAKAREARAEYAAERALNDPLKLKMAARIFRAARARGLMDADGNILVDTEQQVAS